MALSIAPPPISYMRLNQIANGACASALGEATYYEHSKTESWCATIINTILRSLISESSPPGGAPKYKYVVNSTIIQHLVPSSALSKAVASNSTISSATDPSDASVTTSDTKNEAVSSDGKPHMGRRGMYSVAGAHWNEGTDGLWSCNFEGGESRGLDVVISVIWIGI